MAQHNPLIVGSLRLIMKKFGNEWNEYVREDRHKEFKRYCKINSLDPYNLAILLGLHYFLRFLEWGYFVKFPHMEFNPAPKMDVQKAFDETMKVLSGYGYSISQVNYLVQSAWRYSNRGEEVRVWWNKDNGGKGDEKGIIVSNMFTIPI
jgi:hypothetical protein